jgi:pimeloyl-ACP methyl ester carboxylesterase
MSGADDVRIEDLRLPDGRDAYLITPSAGSSGPAILFLHWFDAEAPDGNRTQFRDEATALAREQGIVSLLPQGRFPWAEPPTDADADRRRIELEVQAGRAALDLLAGRDDVDAARIGLVGHDFGAMHGLVLAAEDDRVAAVVSIAATPRWGDWFLPFWPIVGDRFDYLRALHPLDPITVIGRIAPRPVLLQFARDDFYIADMTGLELHRAAGDPKELHAYQSDHAMRVLEARIDRGTFLGRALGWLP